MISKYVSFYIFIHNHQHIYTWHRATPSILGPPQFSFSPRVVAVRNRVHVLDSAMQLQLQHQYNSEGRKGPPSNSNESRGTSIPHENERSRASQSQPQQSPVAALRELTQTVLHRSSSYGSDSRRKSYDVNQTQRQSRCSNSNSPRREGGGQSFRRFSESDSDSNSRYLRHVGQHPFGSRAEAKAKSSSTVPRPYYDSNYNPPPPPLPFVFVKDTVKRSHPPERQNIFSKGKGVILKNPQPPAPSPRRMSQSTQSSESDADAIVDASLIQQPPQFSSNHVKSSHQLRKLCMDIIQSAEEGEALPPRAQIKEVISEYQRSRKNPIGPREPNFTEVSQSVQQSTNEMNNDRRRSRFSESYATKKIFQDQR